MLFICSGCATSEVTTTWREKGVQRHYNRIMVVGIVRDSSLSVRKLVEDSFVKELKALGYNAVSALEEFGDKGLANMEQEATYLKLCNRGIDAVVTFGLLDKQKEKSYTPSRIKYYSSLYYYNRIWNYRNIQADSVFIKDSAIISKKYLWESILFDLQTLSPVYVAQSKSFAPFQTVSRAQQYEATLIGKMQKFKILRRQTNAATELKPF